MVNWSLTKRPRHINEKGVGFSTNNAGTVVPKDAKL